MLVNVYAKICLRLEPSKRSQSLQAFGRLLPHDIPYNFTVHLFFKTTILKYQTLPSPFTTLEAILISKMLS